MWVVEVWEFICSVFAHWVAWISGGVAYLALKLYERLATKTRIKPKILSRARRTGLTLAALIAIFQAWHDQNTAKEAAQRDLDKLAKPVFVFDAIQEHYGVRAGGPAGPVTMVTIEAGLANRGAPSTCIHYMLMIRTPQHKRYVLSPTHIPEGGLSAADSDGDLVTYMPTDSLANRTATTPIPHNGRALGVLVFGIRGPDWRELSQLGSKVEISCSDINGLRHTGVKTTNSLMRERPYMPGMSYQEGTIGEQKEKTQR